MPDGANYPRGKLKEYFMTIVQAISEIESILKNAKERVEESGATASFGVNLEENTIDEHNREPIFLSAHLGVSVESSEELLLPIELAPTQDGEISDDEYSEAVAEFNCNLERLMAKLSGAESKAALEELCAELDREHEEKMRKEMEQMNKAVKSNLRVALGALAMLLCVAAICLVIKLLA